MQYQEDLHDHDHHHHHHHNTLTMIEVYVRNVKHKQEKKIVEQTGQLRCKLFIFS